MASHCCLGGADWLVQLWALLCSELPKVIASVKFLIHAGHSTNITIQSIFPVFFMRMLLSCLRTAHCCIRVFSSSGRVSKIEKVLQIHMRDNLLLNAWVCHLWCWFCWLCAWQSSVGWPKQQSSSSISVKTLVNYRFSERSINTNYDNGGCFYLTVLFTKISSYLWVLRCSTKKFHDTNFMVD